MAHPLGFAQKITTHPYSDSNIGLYNINYRSGTCFCDGKLNDQLGTCKILTKNQNVEICWKI